MAINIDDVRVGDKVSVWGEVLEIDKTDSPFYVRLPTGVSLWATIDEIDTHIPAPKFIVGDTVKPSVMTQIHSNLLVLAVHDYQFWALTEAGNHETHPISHWEKAE